jgi:alkylated DNA repair dioxygenase AlkB
MAPPKQKSLTSFFGSNGTKRSVSGSARTKCSSKRPRVIDGSHFGGCPLCGQSFPLHLLEIHASECTGVAAAAAAASSDDKIIEKNDVSHNHVSEPIPGLFIYEDFITEEEEAFILAQLDGKEAAHSKEFLPWKPGNFNGSHLGKRWGVHCNLRDRKVGAAENPLPHFVREMLLPKLKQLQPMGDSIPNEANAIDYRRKAGHNLLSHVDDRKLSREPIANLSLAGSCYMTFRNVNSQRNTAVKEKKVLLKRRTLQIIVGKARYDFSHGIENSDLLSDRRVSITMRESPLSTCQPRMNLHWNTNASLQQYLRAPLENVLPPTWEPIPGLFLFEDFITEEEETRILQELDKPNDQVWKNEGHTGTHREKRYGMDHDLWSKEIRPTKYPLPNFINDILAPKLKRLSAMTDCFPNDVNAIDYRRQAGHSLTSHVDDRKKHKEPIANLSLAGSCYMTFRNVNSQRNTAVKEKKVLLKRRTLQIIVGKARYDFSHGIENSDLLSDRRVSITMRETLLAKPS